MNSESGNPRLIERQEALGRRPNAALEVVRIKLTDYARAALGVQVRSIPAASSAEHEAADQHCERAGVVG